MFPTRPLLLPLTIAIGLCPLLLFQLFGAANSVPESTWAVEFKVSAHANWQNGQELLSLGTSAEHSVALIVNQQSAPPLLELRLKTTARPEPLVIGMPLSSIDARRPHVFLVRYLSFRVDLFCDGVLVDQEWPLGQVPFGSGSLAFHEPIQQARILSVVPSDQDLEREYGGAAAIQARAAEILGPEPAGAQYRKPQGWNTNAGDAMPFYHDGTFHLFYLIDRRHHHSKWGLGAHQWAHMASADLIHWTSYPVALPISHQWEGSICTGSVFFDKGTYYAFYATRMPDRTEHLGVALSKDGIHFTKVEPSPFSGPVAPFRVGPNRDPHVNRDDNGYLMTVTAALQTEAGAQEQGALEQLRSTDLKNWLASDQPFLVPGYSAQPECSDLFLWRGHYYLLFGINGVTHYRIGSSLHGPWTKPQVDVLDAQEARVMKTAEFHDNRRILVGWIGQNGFGGNLIFRELIQNADGTLGTKFPQEMYSDTPADAAVNPQQFGAADRHVVLQAGQRKMELAFERKHGPSEKLIVDPAGGTVQWLDDAGHVKDELAGLQGTNPVMRIELARQGDLVDICVNRQRTMIHRLAAADAAMSLFKN